jgi:hypothetical protein
MPEKNGKSPFSRVDTARAHYFKCDEGDICQECHRNSGFWGLHPNLGCRRGKLTELADYLFPGKYPIAGNLVHILTNTDWPSSQDQDLRENNDHQSILDLLALIRVNIKRLREKSIFRSGLYLYLIDLIEEDADIAREDV